ncbi:hypothetical protein BJD62_gp66 [Gordonia phage Lucky10]|uniref:Uncharacterized protein n=1 Tax=Gordonia phage Lucky10 TaxID=1821557 RepID=A0A142KB26_9CAUD|nr:hypothetical protein BJD62_gp66 [Gordonia phage Lucky10]AMS03309.1 hypothetical protein SEA_LUCKY10_66 [Gordonia phage Lucky10]
MFGHPWIDTRGPDAQQQARTQADTRRDEARQWWADQPARIAARLEEHQ